MSIDEKVKLICKDNQYLLDEIEVKEIIKAWKKDIEYFEYVKVIMDTYIKDKK